MVIMGLLGAVFPLVGASLLLIWALDWLLSRLRPRIAMTPST
jgi:uncharacterized iron-regulated membrane protein